MGKVAKTFGYVWKRPDGTLSKDNLYPSRQACRWESTDGSKLVRVRITEIRPVKAKKKGAKRG